MNLPAPSMNHRATPVNRFAPAPRLFHPPANHFRPPLKLSVATTKLFNALGRRECDKKIHRRSKKLRGRPENLPRRSGNGRSLARKIRRPARLA